MIKSVIFDIDDTLYSYVKANKPAFAALTDYAQKELKISPEEFQELHGQAITELRDYMGDVASWHDRLIRYQYILERKGLPLYPHALRMEDIYWNTLIDAAVPSEGAVETLKALKNMGLRLGIGTDMTARPQYQKLTKLGLLPYVDFVVCSEEAGREKPHPVLFARCVWKSRCEASECLFVGDILRKDVYGAMNAGLKAVWYCPEGGEEADVPKITRLTQLPGLIPSL